MFKTQIIDDAIPNRLANELETILLTVFPWFLIDLNHRIISKENNEIIDEGFADSLCCDRGFPKSPFFNLFSVVPQIVLDKLNCIVFIDTRKLKSVSDYTDDALVENATCIVENNKEGLEYFNRLTTLFNQYSSNDKAFNTIKEWEMVKETQQPYQPYSMPTEKSDLLDNPTSKMA
jgi:hypothetical protein